MINNLFCPLLFRSILSVENSAWPQWIRSRRKMDFTNIRCRRQGRKNQFQKRRIFFSIQKIVWIQRKMLFFLWCWYCKMAWMNAVKNRIQCKTNGDFSFFVQQFGICFFFVCVSQMVQVNWFFLCLLRTNDGV